MSDDASYRRIIYAETQRDQAIHALALAETELRMAKAALRDQERFITELIVAASPFAEGSQILTGIGEHRVFLRSVLQRAEGYQP